VEWCERPQWEFGPIVQRDTERKGFVASLVR
jgi:hypothetical protein